MVSAADTQHHTEGPPAANEDFISLTFEESSDEDASDDDDDTQNGVESRG